MSVIPRGSGALEHRGPLSRNNRRIAIRGEGPGACREESRDRNKCFSARALVPMKTPAKANCGEQAGTLSPLLRFVVYE